MLPVIGLTRRIAFLSSFLLIALLNACATRPTELPEPIPATPTSLPSTSAAATPIAVVDTASAWRYWYQSEPPPASWYEPRFDDSAWATAQLPIGTNGALQTRLADNSAIPTIFLRGAFQVDDPSTSRSLTLVLDYEDGAAVYLNGVEIIRTNLEPDAAFGDTALNNHETLPEKFDITQALSLVKPGGNSLALEVHRREGSDDLRAEVELIAWPRSAGARFVTGPILGVISADSVQMKAESDIPATAVVEFGPAGGSTTTRTFSTGTSHHITLDGLQPGIVYRYRLGLQTEAGATWSPPGEWTTDGGPGQTFRFAVWADSRPTYGSAMPRVFAELLAALEQRKPLAFGVAIGDNVQLSEGPTNDRTVRDRYLNYLETIGPLARQMPFYATVGNHDEPECEACLAAFRQHFVLPDHDDQTYYSFNYGAAHFVVLNTQQGNGSVIARLSDNQWEWLNADLAANTQAFTFIFAHDAIFHGEDKYKTEEAERLHELFRRSGVTAVFQGDAHYYDYFDRDKIAYVITGGAGSPLYEQPYNPDWQQHEALVVEVGPAQVIIEAVLPNGNLLDSRTLTPLP